jgi:O-methyltransferase domain/Dimerisation domain
MPAPAASHSRIYAVLHLDYRHPPNGSKDMEKHLVPNAMMTLTNVGLGYFFSAALRAVTELGIADLLADGPKSSGELAEATSTSQTHLHRTLRALAGCGLFAQNADGRFQLTTATSLLRRTHACSLRDAVLMMTNDAFLEAGIHLLDALRNGGNAFEAIHGISYFEHLQRTPTASRVFHAGMANFSNTENAPIAAAYDFSRFSSLVDVGGGYGGFLKEVLSCTPGLRGVLYETADVCKNPERLMLDGVLDCCEIVEGDFFTSVPPGADAYVLKRVLHAWNDDQCRSILRHCRDSVGENGRVLIIDAVVREDNKYSLVKGVDLLMLAASDGHERSEQEFATLLASAGLELLRVVPTPSLLSILEAAPA